VLVAVIVLALVGVVAARPGRAARCRPGRCLPAPVCQPVEMILDAECIADTTPKPQRGDTEAIRQVLDNQVAAWNKGDLEGFMKGYWSSPRLSFFSGNTRTQGWQPTLARFRKRYQAEGKEMGRLRFEDVEIDVLSADAAMVRGRFRLQLKKEKPTGLFTLLFRRLPEGWRIVHDHTSG
jgi:beta-aspartyl-peptidase (threonine type)